MFNWTDIDEFNKELNIMEKTLSSEFPSENMLLKRISNDIMHAGGKRLRPALLIASAMTKKYDRKKTNPR